MNNHIFDRVETLVGDFAATLAAIHKANKEQGEIITATRARMEADKQRVEARRAELQAAVKDNGRSATVRSLAQAELDGLSATEFKPTAAEQAAFGDATARAEQAIADLRQTCDELRTALAAASAELGGIRADTIAKTDIEVCARWIEGNVNSFNNL
jgi:chromosome segregation ATPase